MNFDDDEKLDNALRNLGTGTPFSVDWRDYDARLAQRLFERERNLSRSIRRKGIVYAAFGACAGAALTAAAVYLFVLAPVQSLNSPSLSSAATPSIQAMRAAHAHVVTGQGAATFYKESPAKEIEPFQTDIVRTDGSVAQIRFDGFSAAPKQGWIAAHARNAKN